LFDVYGTLLVSISGDVGSGPVRGRAAAVEASWTAMARTGNAPAALPVAAESIVELQEATIRRHHAHAQQQGTEYPEVDIVEIWREVFAELATHAGDGVAQVDPQRWALEYEAAVNPVWPMPGLVECLGELRGAGLLLGLVSNAQFFTPLVFAAAAGGTVKGLGFDEELLLFSCQHGHAKPGEYLYREAADRLARRGIDPEATLYVGNDLLKDILPASRVGFRTALFAGDARSLRRREGDARVQGIEPDLVLTELRQLPQCVAGQ
jgi:putative hydrolase of the HAD superfamily